MEPNEQVVIVEGPAHFLDAVYETIEGHINRTREEYEQVITGVSSENVGNVDQQEDGVLRLYVLGEVDQEDALEWVNLGLDRIADENNMDLARQSVQVAFEEEVEEEEM